jgi:hypothetical protein
MSRGNRRVWSLSHIPDKEHDIMEIKSMAGYKLRRFFERVLVAV